MDAVCDDQNYSKLVKSHLSNVNYTAVCRLKITRPTLPIGLPLTRRLTVDPVPTDAVVDGTSVSSNPDRSVLYQAVRVTNYELLKHVVNILISDDRQR